MIDTKVYWEERLNKSYDLHSVGYKGLGKGYNRFMYKIRRIIFNNFIKKLNLQKQSEIMDIGSGTGFYIDLWKKAGYKKITGLDITSIAIKNLTNKYPDFTFFELDISSGNLPDFKKQFDCISVKDDLNHKVEDSKFEAAKKNKSEKI